MTISTLSYGSSNDEANRHHFIADLVHDAFPALHVESIVPMGKWNNHMHLVSLSHVVAATAATPTTHPQFGTVPLPAALPTHLVVRIHSLTGNNIDLAPERKVRTEVATMALVRASGRVPVPDVYLWSDEGWTFIVMSHMAGVELTSIWDDLSHSQHVTVATNVARTIAAIRTLTVPDMYGTLDFDSHGSIVVSSGHLSPAQDYEALIRRQLATADTNVHIDGWRAHGLRDRIDMFLSDASERGFKNQAAKVSGPPTLTHGDIFTSNILVDPQSLEVTAVLDWELSSVSAPANEFFMSLAQWGFLFSLSSEDDGSTVELVRQNALLSDFYDFEPEQFDESTAMRALGQAMIHEDVLRPATIPYFVEAARLYWFAQELCHWFYNIERFWSSERSKGALEKGHAAIDKFLKDYSF